MRNSVFIFLSFFCLNFLVAQEDPVLFSVEGNPVTLSEFDYIYNKNNGQNADYSKQSLEEYLDLYVNFKLKVQRAREMKLDTIKSLQKELDGYRKQLSNAYLVDNEVSDNLIKEVFERKKQDLRISHILIASNANDNLVAQKGVKGKIQMIQKALAEGLKFEDVAKQFSDDKQSANKGGDIGYITAMLPQGFYEFESEVYGLKMGQVSKPVKSPYGYHIAKVTERRPARGEMEIGHLLIRSKYKGQDVPGAKMKIDSLYRVLQSGADFEELCKEYSQDLKTKSRGGYLGFFGINRYEKSFEDAAFNLKKDGDIAEPIETAVGYHIIRRISKKDLSDYSKAKKQLKRVVSNSSRFDIARNALIEQIKKDGSFTENKNVLGQFKNTLTKDFFNFQWKIPELPDAELFSFNNGQSATIREFAAFCKRSSKTRLRYNKKTNPQKAADEMYQKFVTEAAIKYEESTLENKYPEFKALMREYSEGILLFEATEREVWSKASSDTLGLQSYYESNKSNYLWKERARVTQFDVGAVEAKKIKKIYKLLNKKSLVEIQEKFKSDNLKIGTKELVIDRTDDRLKDIKKWKVGELTKPKTDVKIGKSTIFKILEILPSGQKQLSDSRGYVISDYQDSLEKAWISNLKSKYKVEINDKVFKSLIK